MNKWKILLCAFMCILVIAGIPLAIDWFIIGNNVPSHISNSEWVGFLGTYIGSIISCIITLVGIIWTIRFTRNQNKSDRELQIRPYFDIVCNTSKSFPDVWKGYISIITYSNYENIEEVTGTTYLFFKNVGQGSAINVNFQVVIEGVSFQYEAGYNNQNALVSGYSVSPNERAAITIDLYCNKPSPNRKEVEKKNKTIEELKACYPENFKFAVDMTYGDLLGNSFTQRLKFSVSHGLKPTNGDIYKTECDINLIEIGIPEKQSMK